MMHGDTLPRMQSHPTATRMSAGLTAIGNLNRSRPEADGDGDDHEGLRRQRDDLRSALTHEHQLFEEQRDLLRETRLLGQESDHRLLNGLQLVASLLALQARQTASAEVAAELNVAARRVATIGNLHRRLHAMDLQETVDVAGHLQGVCSEANQMLAVDGRGRSIAFIGLPLRAQRRIGISLGFIVAELITNAAKYASGDITVTLKTAGSQGFALSVIDEGPGLPEGFNPRAAKGLGMKIIASLVTDIAAQLLTGTGDDGRGARVTVLFTA
jgi:two-component sensor histidine kinase